MNSLSPTLIILLASLLFLLGYKVGKWRSTTEIKKLIDARRNSYLLGQIIKDETQRKELAKAYYNSDSAYKEMANYHWDAQTLILSPFIGYAPAPSNQKNIQINPRQFCAFENIILTAENRRNLLQFRSTSTIIF